MSDGIVRWTARRLPGVDEAIRGELVESAGIAADRGGPLDRALEVGSLVGFALRTMSRRGALDDRREMVRQGLRVGALVLALAAALRALAGAHDVSTAALAVGASVTAIAIASGLRVGAVAAAGATVMMHVAASGSPNAWSLVVLLAVGAGHRFDARPCRVGGLICAASLAAGGIVAALAPAPSSMAIVTSTVVVTACGLLAVGWFDPRFAVAATVVWCSRFVAVDVEAARWLPMLVGLAVGWTISDVAMRRTLTVFR